MSEMENLKFRISTGLKNIIGRELITDKFIAIFELVKNSYDAGANRVDIIFENIHSNDASITISDNGYGMDENDIINKWLFVAYSEKSNKRSGTYRDEYTKRTYAGAKGVGRFSCDRLGSKLDLYSRKSAEEPVNLVSVDWDRFEADSQEEFVNIPVSHQYVSSLLNGEGNGTCVVAKNLRESWDRTSLLELKKSLSRLINPYVNAKDNKDMFEIYLLCDDEKIKDEKIKDERDRVNGQIKNYVFETLNLKTTHITVTISESGDEITTKMSDRGTFLFELRQASKFNFLKNIIIELFYLNRSAKMSFKKYMGIHTVEFGSILVYKNGFRVMPYGEPGADTFEIDRRKQQGYNRFLGTRDLMGRISILGDNPEFIETSSRAGGFINTKAFDELSGFFKKFAHYPLERYVVNLIAWGDPRENNEDEIMPSDIKKDVIKYITNYEKKGHVISLVINPDLANIVEERKSKQEYTDINALKSLAKQYDNYELDKLAQRVEKQTTELRKDRQALSSQVDIISDVLENKELELQATKKQALFLRGLTNPHIENATKSMHLMKTHAESVMLNAKNAISAVSHIADPALRKKVNTYLFEIIKAVEKINGTFNTARYADYDVGFQKVKMNIVDYITQFVYDALLPNTGDIITVTIKSTSEDFEAEINPTEFGILIDNIIFNSYKARAKDLIINISADSEYIEVVFSDDGVGLNEAITDVDRVFELGFTTTGGSGVGLAHAKKIISDMGGDIFVNTQTEKGFSLTVRLRK